MVNGKSYTIDAPPVIVKGRTFVPVRFVAEILGATVEYDATTRTVKIIRDILP
ncbi:MAG TPA: copper amine oxidase N-terminal domain-containing protein [Caldisericia bacterium]|nr:copper amine oxidase N-terminal domain-containing protein [Caldisericia bacterium]